ncbi:glycosyltransferase family 2 protein [Avibacterium paragallinarum]
MGALMTNNFLSIVIPLYNKQYSIRRAVESVLNQSYQNFEIIVVNDGSTDESLLQVSEIKDTRVKVISIENSGVAFARNLGIEKSRSKYVCLLDGDDEYYPEFLAEINKMISINSSCSLYSCRYEVIDSNGHLKVGNLSLGNEYFGIVNEFYKSYSLSRSLVCSSSVCINKDLFNRVGGFPVGKKTGEDIYVWLNLNLLGPTFFSSKILSLIHQDAENRTNTRVDREIPYHLEYFLFNRSSNHQEIIDYCEKSAFIQSVDALRVGNLKIYRKYLNYFKINNLNYFFTLVLFRCIPSMFLENLKNLRNFLTKRVSN